ncbi:hypothetical protein CN608_09885 [Bacillus pseudomycoides]|nr:hypothetical protein CN608_09885 [Bacillus pseudomycoides]
MSYKLSKNKMNYYLFMMLISIAMIIVIFLGNGFNLGSFLKWIMCILWFFVFIGNFCYYIKGLKNRSYRD